MNRLGLLRFYHRVGLTAIPLKPRSKAPLVKWRNGWNPRPADLNSCGAVKRVLHWGMRCGENFAAVDCAYEKPFHNSTASHDLPAGRPVTRTGRGNHFWLKPTGIIRSRRLNDVEIKCLGTYVVDLPSIQPSSIAYLFEVPLMTPFSSMVCLCRPGLSCGKYITSLEVTKCCESRPESR